MLPHEPLRAAVVDDEPLARSRLIRFLEQLDVLTVAEGCNGRDALDIACNTAVDLLFLDINMPGKNGLDVALEIEKTLENPPAIIFCTAYDQYALKAFSTNAAAYLLKPFSLDDVAAALNRAASINRLQLTNVNPSSPKTSFIAVSNDSGLQKIALSEIAYFQSNLKHIFVHLNDGSNQLVDLSLKELEDRLQSDFVRVNRSTLVNSNQLVKLLRADGVLSVLLRSNDLIFSVSRRRATEVKKCFE
jgi:two-component system response regulator AlgR